jgi:hypothetical protein
MVETSDFREKQRKRNLLYQEQKYKAAHAEKDRRKLWKKAEKDEKVLELDVEIWMKNLPKITPLDLFRKYGKEEDGIVNFEIKAEEFFNEFREIRRKVVLVMQRDLMSLLDANGEFQVLIQGATEQEKQNQYMITRVKKTEEDIKAEISEIMKFWSFVHKNGHLPPEGTPLSKFNKVKINEMLTTIEKEELKLVSEFDYLIRQSRGLA